jgi:hypothetical protein
MEEYTDLSVEYIWSENKEVGRYGYGGKEQHAGEEYAESVEQE